LGHDRKRYQGKDKVIMLAVKNSKLIRVPRNIPPSMVAEIMDGKPVYYKGYKQVLENIKTPEEIMGASSLQSVIISYILRVLFRSLDEKEFQILTNEAGLHLDKKNNLSGDILIYESSKFAVKDADKHYATIPPKIQIEVDIEVDTENFGSPDDYMYQKTQKLLDFGVEKVIWVSSNSKKVLIATSKSDWSVSTWHKNITVIDNVFVNIGAYLEQEKSPFA
jgi:Uma2 family endonuclease